MKKRVKAEKAVAKKPKEKVSKIQGNSFGASGFTLGILSVISLGFYGAILSVVGVILCIIQQTHKKTKLGKAGLILNIIGFVLSLAWVFYFAPIIANALQQIA